MTAEATICFTPDSLADYTDALVLVTPKGQLQVPVLGRRPPPALTLPDILDVGHVVLSGTTAKSFQFVNMGGEGQFQLLSVTQFQAVEKFVADLVDKEGADAAVWDATQQLQSQSFSSSSSGRTALQVNADTAAGAPSSTVGTLASTADAAAGGSSGATVSTLASDAELELGRFRVSPARFGAQPGQTAELHVSFSPCETGRVEEEVVMVCDNCQVHRMLLRGHGSLVDVEWMEVDGRSITAQDKDFALWFGEVRARVLRIIWGD
jgi:hypothetical protein